MSTLGPGASKILSVLAAALALALVAGCGPSPAYFEAEPRTPAGYQAPPGVSEPAQSAALAQEHAARADVDAQAQAQGEPQPAAGDLQIGANPDEYSDTDPSALTDWRPALENHGAWVDDTTYGTIWVPSSTEVGADFQPYVSAGHWTYGETESWVWVSDYEWGWVPFHYGRWVHLSGHGWAWIPGRVYSGAWVVWRTGPYGYDYVGWAPAPPEWYWYGGFAVGWSFGWHHPHYVYCSHDHLYRPHVGSHVVHGGTPAAAPMEARTQPYRAATPAVAGSGRVAATPGVGGGGRVVATPGVGGRGAGPRPGDLGIKQGHVVAPPADDTRIARAQAFASPATATLLGASPPSSLRPRRVEPDAMAGAPAARFNPSVAGPGASPFVSSRIDPVARGPQVQGVPPRSPSAMSDPAPFSSRAAPPGAATTVPRAPPLVDHWQRPSPVPSPGPTAPTFRSAPAVRAAPSAPTYHAPSVTQSAPTYHAPSVTQSAPTYHAPSVTQSAPTFRPSTPSVRSTPSVTQTPSHSSSPSRAAPSVGRSGGARRR